MIKNLIRIEWTEIKQKKFNKIFLAIPAVAVTFIIIFALTSIDTDIKEHEALREIQILDTDFYLDGFDIRVDILVYNPNTQYDIDIDRIDIFVYAGNNNIGEITIPKYITIPKNTQVSIPADITIRKTGILTSVFDYVRDKDTGITIRGTVYYDSIFGTHTETFFKEYNPEQKTPQISTRDDCNYVINLELDILETALDMSYSVSDFEQIMYEVDPDNDPFSASSEICNDRGEGMVNNPNVNVQTKNRMYDIFSKIADL